MAEKTDNYCIKFLNPICTLDEDYISPDKITDSFDPKILPKILELTNFIIVNWDCNFVRFEFDDDFVHPTEGCPKLLGGENAVVCVMGYTPEEFTDLLKTATKVSFNLKSFSEEIGKEFNMVKIKPVLDHKKTLEDLEIAGLISIRPSTNMLARDQRRFEFTSKCIGIVPGISDYLGNEYEADCLRSSLCTGLTNVVICLWKNFNLKTS
ncbi:hypothetical protein OAG24_00660 [bacterium]|nr:hypothetical protein [bacterium]